MRVITLRQLSDELDLVTENIEELLTYSRYICDYDLDSARFHIKAALRLVNKVYAKESGVVI